jgi:predicted metal-dependent HD superfamily phosphohydrolase
VFESFAQLSGGPKRHCPSHVHMAECLRALDEHRDLAERPAEVELTIWFNGAIHDTHRGDNEEASARLAVECFGPLSDAGVAGHAPEPIAPLIRWAHCPTPSTDTPSATTANS